MKVLIVYASAGAGHFKAAEALNNHLKTKGSSIELKFIDILDATNPLFKFNYSWGYSSLVKYAPLLWQAAFWITASRLLTSLTRPIAEFINQLNTARFRQQLISDNPDVVVSTHFLSAQISAGLKKSGKINSRLITVITDFGVHPFWINAGTDTYVVASGFTKRILLEEGIKESSILELGIPVDAKFLQHYDKKELCARLGIDSDKFTVLISTGSFGEGPIEEITQLLHKEVQVLVVCARNKKLFTRLKNKNYSNVMVFGFVDNMQELMSAATLMITKPGGLSISEMLIKELVPVFIWPIPGQETINMDALKSYGIGSVANEPPEIKKIVLEYKESPDKLNNARGIIRKIKKPSAAQELCDEICKGSSRPAC